MEAVLSADDLQDGDRIVLAGVCRDGALVAMSATQARNNRSAAAGKPHADGTFSVTEEAAVLTLQKSGAHWALFDPKNDGYLYAASSQAFRLRTQSSNDANGLWTLTLERDGTAFFTAAGENTNRILRFSEEYGVFDCVDATADTGCRIYRVPPKPKVSLTSLGVQTRTDGVFGLRFGIRFDCDSLQACAAEGDRISFGVVLHLGDLAKEKRLQTQLVWTEAMRLASNAESLARYLADAGLSLYETDGDSIVCLIESDEPVDACEAVSFLSIGEQMFSAESIGIEP